MGKLKVFIFLIFSILFFPSEVHQQTAKDVPSWAKKAIWYQIFVERFRNGYPANDPQVQDLAGSWPHEGPKEWMVHPWTSDWYKLQPWEEKEEKGFYYVVQRRRYGGDLQGVLEKLDYLKDLGVTAIYFNPLFESPSLHKYDASMYHHIDNNFGPNPERDKLVWNQENPEDPATWKWTSADSLFLQLLRACHSRGIRVIVDGVFNHVGMTFWAFRDVVKNQQNSRYKDWFTIKRWDDPKTAENEFDYAGWYGVRELPELREDENGIVEGPRTHIQHIVKRWMDPNGDGDPSDGIDGWRLDVADMVNANFWREFRAWVRAINPEAYLVGEVWWEDWKNNKMFNAAPWLQGDIFDAVMNYRFANEVVNFFVNKRARISPSEFSRRLDAHRADYPWDVNYVLMNLLDSHDTERFSSFIVNPDRWYDHQGKPADNPEFDVRKPTPYESKILKLAAVFQATYLGAPMIYYGTEAGMWGGDDPDCRKPMTWPDMTYEDEAYHPLGKSRPRDRVKFDSSLHSHYKKLFSLRQKYSSLSVGSYRPVLADDERNIFAFERSHEAERITVVLNNSDRSQEVVFTPDAASKNWQDLLTGEKFSAASTKISVHLDPMSARILLHSLMN